MLVAIRKKKKYMHSMMKAQQITEKNWTVWPESSKQGFTPDSQDRHITNNLRKFDQFLFGQTSWLEKWRALLNRQAVPEVC